MNTPLTGKELEEAIKNRKIARKMAMDQAIKGDGICGALFALEAMAREIPGGSYVAGTCQDYSDEDDEIRPY